MLTTRDETGNVLESGSMLLDAFWRAGASFEAIFRTAFFIATMDQ
jgi:hypothetical protein